MPRAAQLTPMLRHYLEVKAEHPDTILLYRMGDFYEAFFEDAERTAPILEVALTARHRGKESETPMCGVPYHALEVYLGKLIRAGLRVAICDQVEDPAQAKGLVKREVTRVVTPGTVSDPDLLESKEDNLLAAVAWSEGAGAGAFLDVSTGGFRISRWQDLEECLEELAVQRPREVLAVEDGLPAEIEAWLDRNEMCTTRVESGGPLDPRDPAKVLLRQLGTESLRGFGLRKGEPAVRAAALALRYAQDTQKSDLTHVREVTVRESSAALVLDTVTLTNLEVFRNLREGGRQGTLLATLDKTVSPGGGRLLRRWLRRPLREPEAIDERLQAVGEILEGEERRERLRATLAKVGDPERSLARAVLGTIGAREMAALRAGLQEAPEALADVADARSTLLAEAGAVDPLPDLASELERVLAEAPARAPKDGPVIAPEVDEELDRWRSLAQDSKKHVLALEAREREATGIQSLKIRFNKVFGYYIEITKANQELVPESYVRKQTLVNAERYITPELKELEEQIVSAEERRVRIEEELFEGLRVRVVEAGDRLRALAVALARLDVVATFAEVAARYRYSRPQVTAAGGPIQVEDGRHPVVERIGGEEFVPNDAQLDPESGQIVVLTGPNMGGKSTYLRMVAQIVLMAQAGSFVPAASASIGSVDRIFTRVGASDDLVRGESTFMVEMVETANILRQATSESLVILDEVGRGTATFDGLSLAWAIVEFLHEGACPKTIFATHYHELTELATILPKVVNRTVSVKEWEDRIVFLRKVVAGSSDKSYGLHVARLAGIPESVVQRATEILGNLEAHEYDMRGRPRLAAGGEATEGGQDQLALFAPPEEVVASILADLDLERLSPLAALNLLQALKSRLG